MSESRKWKPDRWTKTIVMRKLQRARRQIYRLVLSDPDAGLGPALIDLTHSEIALEATTECSSSICSTLERIAGRMKTPAPSATKTIDATSAEDPKPATREPKTAARAGRFSTPAIDARVAHILNRRSSRANPDETPAGSDGRDSRDSGAAGPSHDGGARGGAGERKMPVRRNAKASKRRGDRVSAISLVESKPRDAAFPDAAGKERVN